MAESPIALDERTPCLNCGEVLRGAYCHACGQKGGGKELHFHDLVHELVHEFLHFDSKILRTLKLLLFAPGKLTHEYVGGHRVRYVGPVRLFLVATVVLFGLLAFVKTTVVGDEDLRAADAKIALDQSQAELGGNRFASGVFHVARKIIRDPEHVKGALLKGLSRSFFVLLPVFAWVMWRLFGQQQPFYVAHMYFALHFHAFAFILLSVLTALSLAHVPTDGLYAVVGAVIVAYFFAALRRTFGVTWGRALLRGSAALALSATFNCLVIGVLFAGTLFYL
jgi:hypothetical protein